ncbi:hypothetical protein WDU94_013311 [Cyamophila willieti]
MGVHLPLTYYTYRDLSHNKLQAIARKTLRGLTALKTLQVDNNLISCFDELAVKSSKDLEILTLNNNNLTYLPDGVFAELFRLRTLRISDNSFICDCHLSWLHRWLKRYPRLGLYTKCFSPSHIKGQNILDIPEHEFKCSGPVEKPSGECAAEPSCPHPCRCSDGIVDCREKGLSKVPILLPEGTTELDLSKNQISKVAVDAFQGLKSLTSLVLYGNKIKDLPGGVFHGLSSLQLLLLNANEISCIRKDTFKDLHSLNLLSLYDNNIQSLANGTFDSMKSIQTLHLARNPFICDCNLRWLAEYLHKNPIETSGARCDTPKRMQRRRIESLRDEKYKCKGVEEFRTRYAGDCLIDAACPSGCSCDGTRVTAPAVDSRISLKTFPSTPQSSYSTTMKLERSNRTVCLDDYQI